MNTAVRSAQDQRLVVVGGGQAAAQLIEVARQQGFAGPITLVSEETTLPYQRPPLSKQYLTGQHDPEWLLYRPARFYEKFEVAAVLGRRAVAIDRDKRTVRLDDGAILPFDKLALATGTRVRRLPAPGAEDPDIYYIRNVSDVERLRPKLAQARRVTIIGAGFIGLETAAVLVQRGIDVTLIGSGERILPRVVTAEIAEFLLDHHLLHGVKVELQQTVSGVERTADGTIRVSLTSGSCIDGDLVLVGIGAVPNVELAVEAGLECDDGIVVNELAQTSDPDIVAAGDCTNHPNCLLGRRLRLETVHNAVEQGRTAGATIAGVDLPYIQQPWVWSDQYKLRLQSVGIAQGHDHRVLRGSIAEGRFSVFYYSGEELVAVNTVNQPLVFGAARRILNDRIPLGPHQAADPTFDLAALPRRTATLEFDIPWPTKYEKGEPPLEWGFE